MNTDTRTLAWAGTEPDPDDNENTEWMAYAECAGLNLDLFFPTRGVNATDAKAVCNGCTVRGDCLDYALRTHIMHGVWGGKTEQERRRIRRTLRLEQAAS